MSIRDLVPSLWHDKGSGNNTPFSPIETLKEEMDQLFDNFHPRALRPVRTRWSNLDPVNMALADISETDKEIEVVIDLPGFDEKNIDITFSDDQLIVEGKQEDKREEDGKNYYRLERNCGSFRRSFYLPTEVKEDDIEAKFKKGVLTVTLPKSQEARKAQKKIKVKAA